MGAIDWNILQPTQGPAPEVASITGLLSALADRRMKAAQMQQEQAFRERQFQEQQRNTAADNARADRQMQMQRDQYGVQAEQHKAAVVQKQEEEAAKALPGVYGALQAGDETTARMKGEPYGVTLGRADSGVDMAGD